MCSSVDEDGAAGNVGHCSNVPSGKDELSAIRIWCCWGITAETEEQKKKKRKIIRVQ